VLEPELETKTTERNSIEKPDTEDAHVETLTSSNVENTVDQTTKTIVLKLMSDAQVLHTSIRLERLELNSEFQEIPMVGYTEKERMENGDH